MRDLNYPNQMLEDGEPVREFLDELNEDALDLLEVPFRPSDVKWRIQRQSNSGDRGAAITYAEYRRYQDRLNGLFGPNWNSEIDTTIEGRHLVSNVKLTICGVTRSDTGEERTVKEGRKGEYADGNAGTTAMAQGFKRACVQFGLGAYFYEIEEQWVDIDDYGNPTDSAQRELNSVLTSNPRTLFWMRVRELNIPLRRALNAQRWIDENGYGNNIEAYKNSLAKIKENLGIDDE